MTMKNLNCVFRKRFFQMWRRLPAEHKIENKVFCVLYNTVMLMFKFVVSQMQYLWRHVTSNVINIMGHAIIQYVCQTISWLGRLPGVLLSS